MKFEDCRLAEDSTMTFGRDERLDTTQASPVISIGLLINEYFQTLASIIEGD